MVNKIEYYDNKTAHGIIIDWKEVFKRYKKLKIPADIWTPTHIDMNNKYIINISERSTGKTTNWLLLGMVLNSMYGTVIQYIRDDENNLRSHSHELFKAIEEYENGRYIEDLTEGKYNAVKIHWRKAYYCRKDEDGKIIDSSEEPFLQMLAITHSDDYKSSYNAPKGDLIIYDEFLTRNSKYIPNKFLNFCDILSTIIRKRKTPVVVLLANSVDFTNDFFKELEISKEIKNIKAGESKQIITEKGTPIYFENIGVKQTQIKKDINRLFFGFSNPQLSSITGGGNWSFANVPHIVNTDTDKTLDRTLYIQTDDGLLQAEFVLTEKRGIVCNIHPATRVYDDSTILTNGEILDIRYRFGFGFSEKCRLLWELYKRNKCFYDTNETGAIFENYVKKARVLRKG